MKKILSAVVAGACIGVFAASHAKLPPAPPKSEEQKKAEAEKAAATKAKEAEHLNKAMDKAVANYKKNKGASMGAAKK
jgi:gas vesicle protein